MTKNSNMTLKTLQEEKLEEWRDTEYHTGLKPNQNEQWILKLIESTYTQALEEIEQWAVAHQVDDGTIYPKISTHALVSHIQALKH